MPTGFAALNTFEGQLRRQRQLYDFTADLYHREHERLTERVAELGGEPVSFHTSTGLITHSLQQAYEFSGKQYPERLRSLLLIGLVTLLEEYLSNLVSEIAARDLQPFYSNASVSIPKGKLLSYPSLDSLKDDLIAWDIRDLTSGGLDRFRKYFRSHFGVDFGALGTDYRALCELHDRRHIQVHRNGICDAQFAHRYPDQNVSPGQKLTVSHEYLADGYELVLEFSRALAKTLVEEYPEGARNKQVVPGPAKLNVQNADVYLVRCDLLYGGEDGLDDVIGSITSTFSAAMGREIGKFLVTSILEEGMVTLVVRASPDEFRSVMGGLKMSGSLRVREVSLVERGEQE